MKKKHLIGAFSAMLAITLLPLTAFADETTGNTDTFFSAESLSSVKAMPNISVSLSETYIEKGKTAKFTVMLTDAVGKVSISTSNKNIVSLSTNYEYSRLDSDGTLYLWLDSESLDGSPSAEIVLTGGTIGGNAAITVKAEDAATIELSPQKYEGSQTIAVSNDSGADGWVKKNGYWYSVHSNIFDGANWEYVGAGYE